MRAVMRLRVIAFGSTLFSSNSLTMAPVSVNGEDEQGHLQAAIKTVKVSEMIRRSKMAVSKRDTFHNQFSQSDKLH